jgi:hypothetical protein
VGFWGIVAGTYSVQGMRICKARLLQPHTPYLQLLFAARRKQTKQKNQNQMNEKMAWSRQSPCDEHENNKF